MLALAVVASAEDAGTIRLELREDRLTLHVRGVPIERVLAQLADRLGIDVRGQPAESRRVTADFEAVPVAEAFHRLLDRESFTLTYAANGGLQRIALHGRLREPPSEPVPEAAPPAVPPPQLPQAVAAARPDPTGTSLIVARPTSGDPLQETPPEQRTAIRAAASRTMLGAMVRDEGFLERLRANTGEGPDDFLTRLAASASSEDVRAGAAAALEDLQRQAGRLPTLEPDLAEARPTASDGRDRPRGRRRKAADETPAPPLPVPGG